MGRQAKFTREQLVAALTAAGGDLTRTAVTLEVAPSTVYRAMTRYGIEVETTRQIKAA
jgi:transcriptional regulator with GAF, ATPase, and Fis domain